MFEKEVNDSLKKCERDGWWWSEKGADDNRRGSNDGGNGKCKANTTEYEICLEPHAMDERKNEIWQKKLDTFSALLNLYHFGQALPMTENMPQTLHGKDTEGSFYADHIVRAGLS